MIYHIIAINQIFQGISGRGLSETVYRVRNDKPQFSLDALTPGRYTLLVYAETPRGRSPRPAALRSVSIRSEDDLDRPGKLPQTNTNFGLNLHRLSFQGRQKLLFLITGFNDWITSIWAGLVVDSKHSKLNKQRWLLVILF